MLSIKEIPWKNWLFARRAGNTAEKVSEKFPGQAPKTVDELKAFHNLMQEKRSGFYKDQAKREAVSWKRKPSGNRCSSIKNWEEEGEILTKRNKAEKSLERLAQKKQPSKNRSEENLSACRTVAEDLLAEGKGKSAGSPGADRRQTGCLCSKSPVYHQGHRPSYAVSPDGIADIYRKPSPQSGVGSAAGKEQAAQSL